MPEKMAEGTEEAGWEDLDAHSIDTGEEDFDPIEESEEDEPTETETDETATDVEPEAEETTDDGTDSDPDGTEQVKRETVTLDGVTYELPEGDLGAAFKKAATHFNQVSHFQELADQRRKELEEIQAQNRQIMDQFTAFQMQQQTQHQQQQAQQQQQAEPRPPAEQLRGAFQPYLQALKEQGRISEDEYEEHQGLISEYLYDTARQATQLQKAFFDIDQRFQMLEGIAAPTYESVQVRAAQERDQSVWRKVASLEGYEALKDPEEWSKLKEFITKKVVNSPKDQNGNPLFDPIFDAETMAEQYDAMQGAVMRKALAQQKSNAEGAKKKAAQQAGGNARGGGGQPQGKPKPKAGGKEPTPEDEALDWTDPNKAIG